jgi:hypothetical protein
MSSLVSIFFGSPILGLAATGLLTSPRGYELTFSENYSNGESRSLYCAGLFYGGSGHQMAANIELLLSVIGWVTIIMLPIFLIILYINKGAFLPNYFSEFQQNVKSTTSNFNKAPPYSILNNNDEHRYFSVNELNFFKDPMHGRLETLSKMKDTGSVVFNEINSNYSWDICFIFTESNKINEAVDGKQNILFPLQVIFSLYSI